MSWWIFKLILGMFLVLAGISHYRGKNHYKRLSIAVIVFYFGLALYLSAAQLNAWSHSQYERVFLSPDYFLPYVAVNFWMDAGLSILVAVLFYFLLRGINKYRQNFFSSEEISLGFLTVLIAGWPGVISFFMVFLVLLLVESLYRSIIMKQESVIINFSLIFFISTAVALFFGDKLFGFFIRF